MSQLWESSLSEGSPSEKTALPQSRRLAERENGLEPGSANHIRDMLHFTRMDFLCFGHLNTALHEDMACRRVWLVSGYTVMCLR
jgi:hypothetical protein